MTKAAPPPVPSETIRALAGALRFCKLDFAAVAAFDPGPDAAKRSFWAAVYGVPFYAALLALNLWQSAADKPADLGTYALVQAIAYVVHTAGFPLAVLGLARLLGHAGQWPLFVTAQNWLGLIQLVALLATIVLDQSGILGVVGTLLLIGVQLYSLVVEGYVAKVTLGVTVTASCAIVLLDIVFGVGIDQLAVRLF
jgi:hypothetical protein